MKKAAPLLILVLLAASARAFELSLEENKASRGNIGYVDLQKVFRLFPGTKKAKESFSALVKEAEDNISLGKGDLLVLRAEITALTIQREMLLKTPVEPPRPAAVVPTASPSTRPAPAAAVIAVSTLPASKPPEPVAVFVPPAPAAARLIEVSTSAIIEAAPKDILADLPGLSRMPSAIAVSTPSARAALAPTVSTKTPSAVAEETGRRRGGEPLILQLPGSTTGFFEGLTPPAEAPKPAQARPVALDSTATVTAPALSSPSLSTSTSTSTSERLQEVESQLAAKKAEFERKEAALREHQGKVEKNLIDIESRRSEILLGKIYVAVQEVARDNGVSVIVDKSQILFGQNAVDLTAKVIKKLEDMPQ